MSRKSLVAKLPVRPPKDEEDQVPLDRLFQSVPALIRARGRVPGVEAIRDLLLAHWWELKDLVAPQSLLKLVLEYDRHALMAGLAEAKSQERFDADKWTEFQKWLKGEVDVPPGGPTPPAQADEEEE